MFARLPFAALLAACTLALPAVAMIDGDGDGISDVWASRYGGNLPPAADPDGDGLDNHHESVAGTDPHDPRSRLAIRSLALPGPAEAVLRWPSAPAKLYRLHASTDLTTWIDLGLTREGDGTELEHGLALDRAYAGGAFPVGRWDDLAAGSTLTTFKAILAAGSPVASRTLALTSLEVPPSSPNLDRFGHHVRGWIVPPTDGVYRFFIAGDDATELWLSPGATTDGLQRIAYITGWTTHREWNKYPSQTSAAITLQGGRPLYFEFYHHESVGGDNFSVAWTGPTLDPDREILHSRHFASDPRSLADRQAESGRLFFRATAEDLDRDGDGLSDHDETFLGTDPLDATTQPMVNDRAAAAERLAARNRITLGTSASRAYELGQLPARITVFRSGNVDPVRVRYIVSGSASAADYTAVSGYFLVPAGAGRAEFELTPLPDLLTEDTENITITLLADAAYDSGEPGSVTVTLDDAPDELFLAQLRPPVGVESGAWGYAAVRAMGNGLSGRLSVSVSALQAPHTETRLFVSTSGSPGPIALSLPPGPITARAWTFDPADGLSREQILSALREGRLWVSVPTTTVAGGELLGLLLPATGAETMPTPPVPPSLPDNAPTLAEAYRFLNQASFGATPATAAALQSQGYAAWIEAQRSLPVTRLRPQVEARRAELLARPGANDGWQTPLHESWWQSALTAPDQLRQRVAWALSQILVVSQEGALSGEHEPAAGYYDLLLDHAFGNYRNLLGEVTRSAPMGVYLSMMRNQKPNAETGQRPDENYAREIMQLFTIGLNALHPDGTLRLDAEGLPIATYTQDDIAGLAHVFTGWGPHYDDADPPRWNNGNVAPRSSWFLYGNDMNRPMTFYPEYHDPAAKRIVSGVAIAAGTPGIDALDTALDTLFAHPNLGPFIGRQLIQRLVTANPSPGYVFRVASVFANNGSGVRGDLFATVRAVLLDPEARAPAPADSIAYGKRAEPVLRLSRFYRAFPPSPPREGDPRLFLSHLYDTTHQLPLGSPSVFNFYQPVYAHPGPIAISGLVSPEFQITTETTVINESNRFYEIMHWTKWTQEPADLAAPNDGNLHLSIPLDAELAVLERTPFTPAENFSALLDHLGTKLLGRPVGPELRASLLAAHAALPSWYWTATGEELRNRRLAIIRFSLGLVLSAPETAIDR